MKNKKVKVGIIVFLVVCLIGVAVFCIVDNRINSEKDTNKDLLVGVFLTTEELFEDGSYAKSDSDDGKCYATLVEKTTIDEFSGEKINYSEYVFKNIEGHMMFYYYDVSKKHSTVADSTDDVFCYDSSLFDFRGSDCYINTTVYINKKGECFYVHPVYQQSDGNVYVLLKAEGWCIENDTPIELGFEDSYRFFEKGELKKRSTVINLKLEYKDTVKETRVFQMTEDSNLIKSDVFLPCEIPAEYKREEKTNYMIIDTVYMDENGKEYIEKEFVESDDALFYIYKLDERNVYRRIPIPIIW